MSSSSKSSELQKTLTPPILRRTAGSVYFARGEEYFEQEAVRSVRERDGKINATVQGTHPYKTTLWIEDGAVEGRCTCPLGADGEFCKHLVATGLAFIEQESGSRKRGDSVKSVTPDDIEAYLSKQKVPELVSIIMEQASVDDEFYTMLRMRAITASAGSNTSEMKQVLRQAIVISDFISWRDTYEYTRGVDRVVGQLRTMLTPKHAGEVVELAEYALELWEESIGQIDDSNGCMGDIRDSLHALHLEACRIAKPDPVALAERLAGRVIESEWEIFYNSYQEYSKIFGKTGRARFREIVEAEWNKLPRLVPGQADSKRYGRSSTLERLMLVFADEDKDLDRAVSIMSRDLSSSYTYLQIAKRYREAREYSLACEWAEKGQAAFPDDRNTGLQEFLAGEYFRAGRPDDALAVMWAKFRGNPCLQNYGELVVYARRIKTVDAWREKAFAHMRKDISDRKAEYTRKHGGETRERLSRFAWIPDPPDHSLLVSVLLWEKRADEAWAEAKAGGCSNDLWLNLARQREKDFPGDAVKIYLRQVEPLVGQGNNQSYEEAVRFLGRAHELMKQSGKEQEFRVELARVKTEYKIKRNFIKYLERKAWGKNAGLGAKPI